MSNLKKIATVWFVIVASGIGVVQGEDKESSKATGKVSVVIDFSDGVQKHFTEIPWKDGLTALEALRLAQSHRRGIRFVQKGSGATAMITKIDDLENEGRGRNWMYRVNGKLADSGVGVQKLADGDSVLWKFEAYR